MVEGAALEMLCTEMYLGFESLTLRQKALIRKRFGAFSFFDTEPDYCKIRSFFAFFFARMRENWCFVPMPLRPYISTHLSPGGNHSSENRREIVQLFCHFLLAFAINPALPSLL